MRLSLNYTGSSFVDYLRQEYAQLLPQFSLQGAGPLASAQVPHGTTVLALCYDGGVLVAGDRIATEGYQVSSRRIEKVYSADAHSAIAIAGVAGPCIELARLFQTELEHYDKIEGEALTLEGKANKLAMMIKQNLPAALQGLVVIPIFAGYDLAQQRGRIFKYDITGGRYEELEFHATGSGGKDARATLKRGFHAGLRREEALDLALQALYDAADEDVGTGGADLVRGIYPNVKTMSAAGTLDVPEEELRTCIETILQSQKAAHASDSRAHSAAS